MHILGISCYYHDSAAALVRDGEIIAAVQEERFTRKKHDFSFPVNSINWCLKEGGISVRDVDFLILDHDLKSLGEEERERLVRSKLLGS